MTVRSLLRWPVRAAALLAAVAWIVMPTVATAQAGGAAAVTPPVVKALLTAEAVPFTLNATRVLAAAEVPSELEYIVGGSAETRRAFTAGEADVIVSGIGLSKEDQDALGASGRGVISAPVQAVGLQVFGFVPPLQLFPTRCDEINPDTGEPVVECGPADRITYTGPIRLRPSLLASAFFEQGNVWNSPDFAADIAEFIPAGYRLVSPLLGPRPLVRSDADAFNQFLETYLATFVPDQRIGWLKNVQGADPAAPPAETWPNSNTASRQGMDNVVSQISAGLDPGSSAASLSGSLAAVGSGFVDESFRLNGAKPEGTRTPLFRVEVKNANGEWQTATPDAITKAIDASGSPLAGATQPVAGAYPITWVNRAYAPASGLTAEQANAVATYIRYQVTVGRGDAAKLSDGRITDAMVTEALGAADRIVESNCKAAKGTVVTSKDGTPYVAAGVLTFGSMKLCQGAPVPTTTTTTAPDAVADTGSLDSATFDSSSLATSSFDVTATNVAGLNELAPVSPDVAGSVPTDPATSSGAASATPRTGATTSAAAAVSRRMPFGIPGQSLAPLDRMVTLGLGALTFLLIRNLAMRGRGAW